MAEFKLSRAVEGHRNDVKCLAAFPGSIVSGSRDETVKFWVERGGDYTESSSLPQKLVVNSLALYRPTDGGSWVLFVGRKDGSIAAFSAGSDQPVAILHEHKSNVSTLFVDQEQKVLMSGSWDANAIVWPIEQAASGGEFNALGLVGHTLSVWAVSTVPNMPDHYLTGSADKAVKFWHHDKELRSFLGHTDVVRSILVVSSSNFFTSSNDSTIRLWDLMTGECLAKYMSLSGDYLYSMCRVGPSASLLATSSEGGLLELWSLDPQSFRLTPKQQISLPAESLWSVAGLSNGDVAVGASDSRIWIFTAESARTAPAEMITAFDEQVAQKMAIEYETKAKMEAENNVVTIKVALEDGTPSLELKYTRGTDPVLAAEQFIQENGLTASYLNEIVEFIKTNVPESRMFGAQRPQPTQRSQLNGREWDYVFEITVEDGRKLKLPYNVGEDPNFAAQRFLEDNELPIQFMEKVAGFLRTQVPGIGSVPAYTDPFTGEGRYVPGMTSNMDGGSYSDPLTGGGRYVPGSGASQNGASNGGGVDPLTGGGRYVPGASAALMPNSSLPQDKKRPRGELVPLKEYFQFNIEQSSAKAVAKLKECNEQQPENRLGDEQLAALETLMSTKIVQVKDVHISALETGLRWPLDSLVPILDVFRIALIHKDLNKHFCDVETKPRRGRETLQRLQNLLASDPPAPVKILVCRSLANATLHIWGRQMLLEGMSDTVRIAVHCLTDPKPPVQFAATSALANWSLMLLRRTEEEKVDEMGPREDALKATLDGLVAMDSFGSYGQPSLVRLLQAIVTLMYGDSALILIAKQLDVVTIVNRIKDAVVDENAKCIARDIVEMTFAV